MNDPPSEKCLEEDQSATHVLCHCEVRAHLRFHHLGQFFMEPTDFYDAPISEVLHLINRGLIKGRSAMVAVQRAGRGPPLLHFINIILCSQLWQLVLCDFA
jgi:hypothetical protein